MTDPMQALQAMLQAGGADAAEFPPSSRYHGVGTAKLTTADGRTIIFLKRRLVPAPEEFSLIQEHSIVQGDRLDNLTATYLGDPEQFWRLCDANGALRPDELTEIIGLRVRITLPHGIPGAKSA
jgi:hypothetical protein